MTEPIPAPPTAPAPSEPLLSVGFITSVVAAVLALLTLFGLDLSPDTKTSILTAVGIVAPIIVAVWGRSKVWSPASVLKLLGRK